MATPRQQPIVLTAGGTGGHMFPAVALGEVLLARGHRVLFATDDRGKAYVEKLDGAEARVVPSASPSRGGVLGKVTFLFKLARGGLSGAKLLRRENARLVVGFGGYASFPTCFMAVRQGVPTVLHEQNGFLGLANRKLAARVAAIATSFPEVKGIPEGVVSVETGNPVRPDFVALHGRGFPTPAPDGDIEILVLGGSQGARVFSDVVPEALEQLDAAARGRIKLTQQCRPEDLDRTREAYAKLGMAPTLDSFFDDVPARIARTHLLICRAGAGSVSEALVAGRPAIYVPYPHAADDHQYFNARQVADRGAGWLMKQDDFTADTVAARLQALIDDPSSLESAASAASDLAKPDAAQRLADLVERTLDAAGGRGTAAAAPGEQNSGATANDGPATGAKRGADAP